VIGDVVEVLGGTSIPQRELVASIAERDAEADVLAAEQRVLLDFLALQRRAEIRGGAGTGKTWLAVEQTRRLARAGERVALICYSRGLAEFLRRRFEAVPRRDRPAYVGTFHGLGRLWGAPEGSDDDSAFWEERLPREMADLAAGFPSADRFDSVVVDEAQDFADGWWAAAFAALRDADTGGLFVFADEGQRVFARQGRPPLQLPPFPLARNLRNTKQIANTFFSLAASQMSAAGSDGPPVRFIPCATEDAVGVADDEADRLLDEGWPTEHVALLTTGSRHPVQVERQAEGQDAYWASYWDTDDLFYGHVLGFKGLERSAVVLAVNGFRDEARAKEMLYVGLSRARDLLVVCGDLELIRRVGGEGVVRRLTAGRR
jgi:superfamily I DNA/RNA helicase